MSQKGSVFQKGGGGTNFEQFVQASFLTGLIVRGHAPGILANTIEEVAFQTTNKGYETDDLFVKVKSDLGEHRLLAQVKHNLTFSVDNEMFNKVIEAFWKDYSNDQIFDRTRDRLLIIKGGLTQSERNHIRSLLNWAKNHNTLEDFMAEVNRIEAKKNRLELFRESLQKANKNEAVDDTTLWQFLRCLDLLEYDFLNESSVDESYQLNLIRLARKADGLSDETSIWGEICKYAANLNKDGGSVTRESIQGHELFRHFDPEKVHPYFQAARKLENSSQTLLEPLSSTIRGFHLQRTESYHEITEAINQSSLTIVTGSPGAGKSSAVKDILSSEFPEASVFVFRADQFNVPHLTQVLTALGVNENLYDVFSAFSLNREKVVFVDSLEKLLEGDHDNAFKQLLSLLDQYPGITLICTSRKYAVDILMLKFGVPLKKIALVEVPLLTDDELTLVANQFPQIGQLLSNQGIRKLLQSPKYLDFALTALSRTEEDLSHLSLSDFRETLWNLLVRDSGRRTGGLPAKREDAFLDIAIRRAREMKLFTKPKNADEEAIDLLEADEIIFQDGTKRRYSPAHDILEDWALVKYISQIYEDYRNPSELFEKLGNEPAIRRAFRLWVETELAAGSVTLNQFIRDCLTEEEIPSYWADELLIAIFRSDDSAWFFNTFKDELLEDQAGLLERSIHILRTACKEISPKLKSSILLPIGSGWPEIIAFIHVNRDSLDGIQLNILNLLFDWDYRLWFDTPTDEECLNVKEILTRYILQIEQRDMNWKGAEGGNLPSRLVKLFYNLAPFASQEITDLLHRALDQLENGEHRRTQSFYRIVVDECLSGLETQRLTRALPDLVIETAWKNWKIEIPKSLEENEDKISKWIDQGWSNERCWGIQNRRSFNPSGIYKTPFFNLLNSDPFKGTKFIVEFLNYAVDFYKSAKCRSKYELEQIKIRLNDGTYVSQWSCIELWVAFRGLSVTHNALESLLMSLEKYLLELASIGTVRSRIILRSLFAYILKESNNVAANGVLASVLMAYPEEAGDEWLPILTTKEFYSYDLQRVVSEYSSLAPKDLEIFSAQKVRSESNRLSHRKKYQRGLADFVLHYQFNIGHLNERIHQIFDTLKEESDTEDLMWQKVLTEMDIRNHKVGEYDENLRGFLVEPEYNEPVKGFLKENQEEFQGERYALHTGAQIRDAYEWKEPMSLEEWEKLYGYYKEQEQPNFLYDRPATLAIIGLRDFGNQLSVEQKNWCILTYYECWSRAVKQEYHKGFDTPFSINLMDRDAILISFHLVFNEASDSDDWNELIFLLLQTLFAPFSDHDLEKILKYLRSTFSIHHPGAFIQVWAGSIEYSKFRKTHPIQPHFYTTKEDYEKAVKEDEEFVRNLATKQYAEPNWKHLDFDQCEVYLLARSLIITPYERIENHYRDFIRHFLPLLIDDLKRENTYSFNAEPEDRKINPEAVLRCEVYFAELFLESDIELNEQIIDLLWELVIPIEDQSIRQEPYEFVFKVFEMAALKLLDKNNAEGDSEDYLKQENLFWNTWRYLAQKTKASGQPWWLRALFFDYQYLGHGFQGEPNEKPWSTFVKNQEAWHQAVKDFGQYSSIPKYLLSLYSTVGRELLPKGLTELVALLKRHPAEVGILMKPSAERLAKILFHQHIMLIKRNEQLMNDYLWLLDKMVDMGSSEAYLYRENVITYKSGSS